MAGGVSIAMSGSVRHVSSRCAMTSGSVRHVSSGCATTSGSVRHVTSANRPGTWRRSMMSRAAGAAAAQPPLHRATTCATPLFGALALVLVPSSTSLSNLHLKPAIFALGRSGPGRCRHARGASLMVAERSREAHVLPRVSPPTWPCPRGVNVGRDSARGVAESRRGTSEARPGLWCGRPPRGAPGLSWRTERSDVAH